MCRSTRAQKYKADIIINENEQIQWPLNANEELKALITNMVKRDPAERPKLSDIVQSKYFSQYY